jgi:hypothetical protein
MNSIKTFYRLYLICFVCTALLSIPLIFSPKTSGGLFELTHILSTILFLTAIIAYPGLGFCAFIPLRATILAVFFPFVEFCIKLFSMPPAHDGLILANFIKALIAADIIIYTARKGPLGLNSQKKEVKNKFFSGKRFALFSIVSVTIAPVLIIISALYSVAIGINKNSGGYILLSPKGAYSVEKILVKGNQELRLIGMAHVGKKEFYKNLKVSFADKEALLLMEGVTDKKKLLINKPDYNFIAANFGISDQQKFFTAEKMPESLEIMRADLDISELASSTIAGINLAGKLYSKEGFKLSSMLELQKHLATSDTAAIFFKDLISKRNEKLLNTLDEQLEKHECIIVPWGALHMPEIEAWAIKQGFKIKKKNKGLLFAFGSYFSK